MQSSSKLLITRAGCWNKICAGGEWCDLLLCRAFFHYTRWTERDD